LKRDAVLELCGRILIAIIFLFSAFGKIGNFGPTTERMEGQGLPITGILLVLAIIAEIGGGLSIAAGFKARLGALALLVFLIPTTLVFHDFWTFDSPERRMQMIQFLKNLAIMGGLLKILSSGVGLVSFDRRREASI
jgi:putative oxidoreductase